MNRNLRNVIHVLLTSAVSAAAIYAVVQFGGSALAPEAATAQSHVCPATGCTAASCHATTGDATAVVTTGTQAGVAASNETQTCPATGCTSVGCHASDGGGSGGTLHGHRHGSHGGIPGQG